MTRCYTLARESGRRRACGDIHGNGQPRSASSTIDPGGLHRQTSTDSGGSDHGVDPRSRATANKNGHAPLCRKSACHSSAAPRRIGLIGRRYWSHGHFAFQACTFNHPAISPTEWTRYLRSTNLFSITRSGDAAPRYPFLVQPSDPPAEWSACLHRFRRRRADIRPRGPSDR